MFCFILQFFSIYSCTFFYFRWDTSISIHVSHCLDDSKCVHIVNYWHILGSSNVSEVTVETIWKKHLKRIIAKLYHMLQQCVVLVDLKKIKVIPSSIVEASPELYIFSVYNVNTTLGPIIFPGIMIWNLLKSTLHGAGSSQVSFFEAKLIFSKRFF